MREESRDRGGEKIFISSGGCLTMTTRTTTMRRYICVLFLFFLIDRPLVGEMTHCAFHRWNTRDAHEKPRRKKNCQSCSSSSSPLPLFLPCCASHPLSSTAAHSSPPSSTLSLHPPPALQPFKHVC